jgi:glucosamine-6-phosphate deaminase
MGKPRIEVVDDDAALARVGAQRVADLVRADPAVTIVPATGQTPLGTYAALADLHRAGDLPTDAVSVVQLDEYLGLGPDDRRSLFGWMERTFLSPLDIDGDRVVRLPTNGDLDNACASIDRTLAGRGIGLAILGLGGNGHVGFNEPPVSADTSTRAVQLTPATIEANARYWGSVEDVPTEAVTLGMRSLLAAASVVVLVSGARKHEIVHRALEGPVGEDVPASFLRTAAGDVTVIVDRAAWEGS